MPVFSKASKAHLEGVDDRLAYIYNKIITVFDCIIVDGARTVAEQVKNVQKGVSKTMNSKHIPKPNQKALAIDAMPYNKDAPGGVHWNAVQKGLNALNKLPVGERYEVLRAYYLQGMVAGVALEKGIKIRQGIDWDSDDFFHDQTFIDVPHTEIVD